MVLTRSRDSRPKISDLTPVFWVVQGVSLQAVPEVVALQRNDEEISELQGLKPTLLLRRWLAHQRADSAPAGMPSPRSGPSSAALPAADLLPAVQQYSVLLHTLDPSLCNPESLRCFYTPPLFVDSVSVIRLYSSSLCH